MPKEFVLSCFAPRENEPPAADRLPDFRAQVTWSRNDFVQIATVNPDAELGSIDSGLYVDLDRKGLNDLIRLLRKARDQAFGRDE